MRPIPYGRHLIDDADVGAVIEVLGGDWLTQGPRVGELEEEIAKRCGARHAVACCSGTAALHLAMLASGAGPGDEIVAPAITFLATANAGLYVGATPRFTDIELPSVLMTPELLEPSLSEKTRAVLPVHFAGLPCNMPAIHELVRSRCPRACILEDASHALGGRHVNGAPVGSGQWADLVILSLHPVKHIAAGEGGLVLTDLDELAERMRRLRCHGTTKDSARLERADEGP
ncbi:MAG: DegT/DnrJ/EryC1/StrS family aminotransferase, partial [Planctomycetota bacterium]